MKNTFIAGFVLVALAACQPQSTTTTAAASSKKQQINDFFASSGSLPVGWVMVENKGFYCQVFEYLGRGSYGDEFNSALAQINKVGKENSANAFLNMRVTSTSYEIQGSKWHASIVNICGDLAVIK